jgi:tetratricopeptide (TPR) repeat protein
MKNIFISAMLLLFSIHMMGQTNDSKKALVDPLDLTQEREQIQKYGVPTINVVQEMKYKADSLYDMKSWKEAALAYEVYAEHANWLANLLSQCIEPFYSASYDERMAVVNKIKSFMSLEAKSNQYKRLRNQAYVNVGLCYKNIGDIKGATAYFYKGLDLLNVDDMEYWALARNAMLEILEYRPE